MATKTKLIKNTATKGTPLQSAINTLGKGFVQNANSNPTDASLGVYNNAYNSYANGMNEAANLQRQSHTDVRDSAIGQAKTQQSSLSNTAYRNMMQANRLNKQSAQRRGMTGGALEKTAVSNINNYNRNVSNVNAGYAAKVAQANTAYNQSLANTNAELAQNLANKKAELGQANIEYDQTEAQRKQEIKDAKLDRSLQVMSDTATGKYTSKKAWKKAIANAKKRAKKTGKQVDKWAVQYAKLGYSNFKKDQKELKAAGASLKSAKKKASKKGKK